MTFSYDTSLGSDEDRVRFNIGDTSTEGHYLEDETITALLSDEGSVGGATVACIEYIITQLSQPDFKLDWLSVSNKEAKEGFKDLLLIMRQKYGVYTTSIGASSAVNLYREDSDQTDGDYA